MVFSHQSLVTSHLRLLIPSYSFLLSNFRVVVAASPQLYMRRCPKVIFKSPVTSHSKLLIPSYQSLAPAPLLFFPLFDSHHEFWDGHHAPDAVGLAIEYIVQSFLTIGGAIKFIPSTGVTLPFISYGGSSLVSAFIVFAIIQALYIIQGNEDEADELEEMEEYEETPDDEDEALEDGALQEDNADDPADEHYTAEKVSLDDLKL